MHKRIGVGGWVGGGWRKREKEKKGEAEIIYKGINSLRTV